MAFPATDNERALQQVTQGANLFSNSFFKTVSEDKPGNLISSPLSAYAVLSMAAAGAGGNTLAQFKRVLHLPAEESATKAGSQMIIDSLNNVQNVTLRMANKIFAAEHFSVKPEFEQITSTYYRSAAEKVNFGNSAVATNTINHWCEQQTNNRIKDLLSPSDVNAMTAMVLVNAVYFKGDWKHKFNEEHTTNRPFHVDANTVKNVPTMYIKDDLAYGEIPEMKASFVEIPYKNEEMSMVVILPHEVDGLATVVNQMQNANLADILQRGLKREVKLYLPKFKIESTIELDDTLQKLGLTDMYTDQANFSGISDNQLAVSKAIQKAFIEVNEEGSEAAAATGLAVGLLSLSIDSDFIVDRPFYYTIVRIRQNNGTANDNVLPIFIGSVADP